ncbi:MULTISPECIES: protein phosphatase CheZ [Afifella]|uniref:protein phosphatase CheZ n=1 Tax=Afifella TaxID=643217 RepID=UPI000FE30C2E|nr:MULTISPECIES: protein phosphatase CheZ [Afifella]MCT8267801.1 protein phosphatase CheZ [Afifella sp. JA880]
MSAKRATAKKDVTEQEAWAQHATEQLSLALRLDKIFTELSELRQIAGKQDEVVADQQKLWLGVESIQHAIRDTRGEIASIHAKAVDSKQFNRAADELDAVVADTEGATETILTSAEEIDDIARKLGKTLGDDERAQLQAINERCIAIFEACNFQDITGQRISKVVNLLQFIESRIDKMLKIWSGEATAFEQHAEDEPEEEGDEALLNGPALKSDENVVSQDDIDSLFN